MGSAGAPNFGRLHRPAGANVDGWRVESRPRRADRLPGPLVIQYAQRLSDVQATANRVKVFLAFGVLGGGLLALLAGLATARRAMEPIAEMTAAAREIERSRDPARADPAPGLRGRGRRAGAHAGVDARGARRGARRDRGDAHAPARVRRRRLARAAHAADLRARQPRAAGGVPRGRAARGRRLGAALLAPDAPARRRPAAARARGRGPRGRRTSRSTSPRVVTEAAAELEPVAGDHEISIAAPAGHGGRGRARRAAPARPQPDGERAAPHRPGHGRRGAGRAPRRRRRAGRRGRRPGHPATSCATRSSSASSAASSDRGGSSGLGLSIVRAVTESHDGTVGSSRRSTAAAPASSCACRRSGPRVRSEGPDQSVELARR